MSTAKRLARLFSHYRNSTTARSSASSASFRSSHSAYSYSTSTRIPIAFTLWDVGSRNTSRSSGLPQLKSYSKQRSLHHRGNHHSISTACSPTAMSTSAAQRVPLRLTELLPAGTVDSHMHIIPPDFERFPISASAQYQPTPHTIDDAINFYTKRSGFDISTPRCILTQVSIYGNDNSALLSGIAALGADARGVVQCDPHTVSAEQLHAWWEQGARGVRINLVSVGQSMTEDEMLETFQAYVNKLSHMKMPSKDKKWVIETYMTLASMSVFLGVLSRIKGADNVRWCLDHFGGLKFKDNAPGFGPGDDPYSIPGLSELMELITSPKLPEVYLKISAQYRMDPDYPSPDALGRLNAVGTELIRKAEERVVWASDWPHTRFGDIDSVPFVEQCYKMCGVGDEGRARREKLFRTNAERLWDMAQ